MGCSKKAILFTRCCDGVATSDELHEMYSHEREITLATFARHVDLRPVAESLGYAHGRHAKGLRLAKDWAVRFYRSKFRGVKCFYLDWSAIDHVFVHEDHLPKLKA